MKTYVGLRHTDGSCNVTANGHQLDLRLDWENHSPTGFEWGFDGPGPAQLALAILADYLGPERKELALILHQKFKDEVVSILPHSAWELTGEDVQIRIDRYVKVARVWRYYFQAYQAETRETDPQGKFQATTF